MNEVVIRKIRSIGRHRVVNLEVKKNHTFITENGIPTHNCDQMSPNGQNSLKRILEENSDQARFIFTSNNPDRLVPPLRSRCQEIHANKLNEDDFRYRVASILQKEGVTITQDTIEHLDMYIRLCYPDLRKCINTLQENVRGDELLPPTGDEQQTADWHADALEMFRDGRLQEARKLIVSQIRPDEYEDLFRLLYRNYDLWGSKYEQQLRALICVKQGIVNHVSAADPEINLSGTLAELELIQLEGS